MINEVLISARQLLGWQMVFFTHKPDLRPNPPLSTLPQHEVSQILFFFKKNTHVSISSANTKYELSQPYSIIYYTHIRNEFTYRTLPHFINQMINNCDHH